MKAENIRQNTEDRYPKDKTVQMKAAGEKNRSGLKVMAGLIGMIRPLLGFMLLAVLMGCAGNLMATFITVLGGYGLLTAAGLYEGMSLGLIFTCILVFAVARGILRYAEQSSNHFIAFKLLARIRHQVFAALRRLAPAKLSGSEKGNLISIITSDIELLEVFYAHTISPIAIAVITSVVMTVFIGRMHPAAGLVAVCGYVLVGIVIPVLNSRAGAGSGKKYRDMFGDLNTTVLDNLYGLEEILQYGQKDGRMAAMALETERLEAVNGKLKKDESRQRIVTDWVILLAGGVMAVVCGYFVQVGQMRAAQGVICVIAIMSSFGPTAALSALSNNLNHTLASGSRVLDLLEETPVVTEITDGEAVSSGDIHCADVSFSYKDAGAETAGVLQNFNYTFTPNRIHGILGKSGCGKSTLLKLLMRFYETDDGKINYGGADVNRINTTALRNHIAYVTQDTFLFHDTIENNIRVAREDASRDAVVAAAKKASIHDFIMSLPKGYDTRLGELGDHISGGEKQRIGIARAFLHDSEVILLDEPTSNIDSLNEGIILSSLKKEADDRTVILVSHRASTMGIAQDVLRM